MYYDLILDATNKADGNKTICKTRINYLEEDKLDDFTLCDFLSKVEEKLRKDYENTEHDWDNDIDIIINWIAWDDEDNHLPENSHWEIYKYIFTRDCELIRKAI